MSDQPIIVVKKIKKGHGGHHGGAWKVAYADFVTAMMAFFLVMWLVGQSQEVKAGVASYFRDPGGAQFEGGPSEVPGFFSDLGEGSESDHLETVQIGDVAERIRRAIAALPEIARLQEQIEVEMSDDGLRVELIESSRASFFDSGSTSLQGDSIGILGVIADELAATDYEVIVEGHTDSAPFSGSGEYTNWELSTERANADRRVMVQRGLRPSQLRGVRGFADTLPRIAADPSDPRNRRVSIVVQDVELHPGRPTEQPALRDDLESEAPSSAEQSGSH